MLIVLDPASSHLNKSVIRWLANGAGCGSTRLSHFAALFQFGQAAFHAAKLLAHIGNLRHRHHDFHFFLNGPRWGTDLDFSRRNIPVDSRL
jgi:hypothetical protein